MNILPHYLSMALFASSLLITHSLSAEEVFDIGSFLDNVLTSTNDEWRLQGDYTLELTVKPVEGTASMPKAYKISKREGRRWEPVAAGDLDSDGAATVIKLQGGMDAPTYQLYVDGSRLGKFSLKGTDRKQKKHFHMFPGKGNKAPDFNMQDIHTGAELPFSDFRGQVVFLDFWTTWCGPCQKPMAHNQDIMSRRGTDWEGKALILGVSLDKTRDKVVNHVAEKDWGAVKHTWSVDGWKGIGPKKYGVKSVPTALLISADGTILWRGHPGKVDAEKLIDEELLKSRL